MKKLLTCLIFIVAFFVESNAQVPQAFNFQGIARDTAGMPIASSPISIHIEILDGTGSLELEEFYNNITTSPSGVFSLQIGSDKPTEFSLINWLTDTYSVRVSIDQNGGTAYTPLTPDVQLLSVPYALAAEKAAELEGFPLSSTSATQDQILIWNGTEWEAGDAPVGSNINNIEDRNYFYQATENACGVEFKSEATDNLKLVSPVTYHWGFGIEEGGTAPGSVICGKSKYLMEFNFDPINFNGNVATREGTIGFGTMDSYGNSSKHYARITIVDPQVPLAFQDTDTPTDEGGLWRISNGDGHLSFSVNTAPQGSEFDGSSNSYKRPFSLYYGGNVGRVGIGMAQGTPQYELDVNGDVKASNYLASSDFRFKHNIHPLKKNLEKILALEGVSYLFRQDLDGERNFSERPQIGFIAQDLEHILPDLVHQDKEGYYSINYMGVIPILVEAIKEQEAEKAKMQAKTDQMQAEITELRTMVNALSQKIDQEHQLSGTTAANH